MTHKTSSISIGSFLKLTLKATFITVPGIIIGAALCATIIGIPLGVALILLACKPMANSISKSLDAQNAPSVVEEEDFVFETKQQRFAGLGL